MVDKWAWTGTSGGPNGQTFVLGNLPEDVKLIADPPVPAIGCDYNMRYWYDPVDDAWKLRPDALPHLRPDDFWAWDWTERYEVDPTDPLRNSWVLKPDAQPVEDPNPARSAPPSE